MITLALIAILSTFNALAITRQPTLTPAINRSGEAQQSEPSSIACRRDSLARHGVILRGWLLPITGQKGSLCGHQPLNEQQAVPQSNRTHRGSTWKTQLTNKSRSVISLSTGSPSVPKLAVRPIWRARLVQVLSVSIVGWQKISARNSTASTPRQWLTKGNPSYEIRERNSSRPGSLCRSGEAVCISQCLGGCEMDIGSERDTLPDACSRCDRQGEVWNRAAGCFPQCRGRVIPAARRGIAQEVRLNSRTQSQRCFNLGRDQGTLKRRNQKYHNGTCRWKAWSQGRVYLNIAELPPHIRQQIADFLASKKPSKP